MYKAVTTKKYIINGAIVEIYGGIDWGKRTLVSIIGGGGAGGISSSSGGSGGLGKIQTIYGNFGSLGAKAGGLGTAGSILTSLGGGITSWIGSHYINTEIQNRSFTVLVDDE